MPAGSPSRAAPARFAPRHRQTRGGGRQALRCSTARAAEAHRELYGVPPHGSPWRTASFSPRLGTARPAAGQDTHPRPAGLTEAGRDGEGSEAEPLEKSPELNRPAPGCWKNKLEGVGNAAAASFLAVDPRFDAPQDLSVSACRSTFPRPSTPSPKLSPPL